MFQIKEPLTGQQLLLAHKTISASTFYMIVQDRLIRRQGLSVVRMGDGENKLWREVKDSEFGDGPITSFSEAWRKNMGVDGIPRLSLKQQIQAAANNCDYFAPSISGLVEPHYFVHDIATVPEKKFVDNFFVNSWTYEQKENLFKLAGKVLIIHKNPNTAAAMTKRAAAIGVQVNHVQMTEWGDGSRVFSEALASPSHMVLASVGPAGKYMLPMIATHNKVVLDIGNAMDFWTLLKPDNSNV